MLQWGRGLLTPEMTACAAFIPMRVRLQWGRGLLTPEIRHREHQIIGKRSASMGPGSFDPGNEAREEDKRDG